MTTETVNQQQARLIMARLGGQAWRNNSGVLLNENGVPVRYGLANDSAVLNKRVKSSDLIGITPVVIQPHHVGQTFGVFTALEIKGSGWALRPSDERGLAQAAFHTIVRDCGGVAGFVTQPDDVYRIIQR